MNCRFAIAALLVCGAAGAQDVPAATVIEAAKVACVAAVRAQMREPGSMQVLRVTRGGPVDGGVAYEVIANAKNGFGGYTGNRSYACVMASADERRVVKVLAL